MAASEEIGAIKMEHKGDDGYIIAYLYNEQKSSSEEDNEKRRSADDEEEKLRSSEDEKLRYSSEEDEKLRSSRKRASTIEEANIEIKKTKKTIPYFDDSETSTDEDETEDEYEDDELSEFTCEEVESIPVKPEEIKVELTDVEKWHYLRIGPNLSSCIKRKGKRVPTARELKAMDREISANEFDVQYFNGDGFIGTHRTNLLIEEDAIHVCQCAKVALQFYNKKNRTDYVVERLVKCMTRPCAAKVYFITFKAKSEYEAHTLTFQAKTWVKHTYDVHIMMCGIKSGEDDAQPWLVVTF